MAKRATVLCAIAAVACVLLPVPATAGGACRGVEVTTARTATIEMKALCFTPTLARVQVGESVTWINRESVDHTVTGANAAWGSLDLVASGEALRMRFSRAGAYPYYCFVHPGMIGAVLVGDANGPGAAGRAASVEPADPSATETASGKPARALSRAPAGSGVLWPALAAVVAVLSAGAGYGLGRRGRAPVGRPS